MTILPGPSTPPRGRSLSTPLLVVVALVVVAVAGVAVVHETRGGSDGAEKTTATTSATASPLRPWRVALHAVSQPAPVGRRFVVYAAADGELELVGLEATTGRIEWKIPASPSVIAPGVAPRVAVVGSQVLYLEGVSGRVARIVAADAGTGKPAWHSLPGEFTGWPAICPDDPAAVCASGRLQNGTSAGALRFDAATGDVLPFPRIGADARELATGLYDIGTRQPEILAATTGGAGVWQQQLNKIFTLRGASTDYGWNFDRIPRIGMYVGSVGAPPLTETPTSYSADLSKAMTAGFRNRDGSVVWRDAGSQYVCSYLACPGAGNPAYSTTADARSGGPTLGLRLRAAGVMSGTISSVVPKVSADARGVLEGFDPATGHTRWSFDFGHDAGLLSQSSVPPRVSVQSIVLRSSTGGLAALDLGSGTRRSVGRVALAWCSKVVTYKLTVPYQAGARSIHDYVGQYALTPCTPAGRPAKAPTRGTPGMRGLLAESQAELAWAEDGAVVAVPA